MIALDGAGTQFLASCLQPSEIDFRSSKINEAGGFGERRRLGGAPGEHSDQKQSNSLSFAILDHVSSVSMWIKHKGVRS